MQITRGATQRHDVIGHLDDLFVPGISAKVAAA